MGFLHYIKNIFKRSQAGGAAPTPRRGGVYSLLPGGSALNVATVYRCVNLLADSVANLPMQYMRQKGDIFVTDTNSRLHYLLTVQPCAYLSAVDFWRLAVQYMLLDGNAYIVPVYGSGLELDRLAIVSPGAVMHDTTNDMYTIHDAAAGIDGTYDEDSIIHIKNYSRDGKTGLSTLSYASVTIDIAQTGDRETLNRFANGGNVRGLVSNDNRTRGFGELPDEQLAKAAVSIDEKFSNGEKIVSLPGDVQFSPISLSSTDMQFLESRKFTVRDICRFFGVHPSFVFDDTSNNYKSAETANVAFLSTTLNPILRKIEAELLRKLVAPSLCGKRKFEFDRRGLYACDLESRIKYQAATIGAGIYSVNDWRIAENKPVVTGGDTILVSANLRTIEEVKAGKTAPEEPKAEEPEPKAGENEE